MTILTRNGGHHRHLQNILGSPGHHAHQNAPESHLNLNCLDRIGQNVRGGGGNSICLLLGGYHPSRSIHRTANEPQTHYQVLGVDTRASDDQIKSAYYRLSLVYHPDKNTSTEATEKFQRISEAYEILSKPESKSDYDRSLGSRTTTSTRAHQWPRYDRNPTPSAGPYYRHSGPFKAERSDWETWGRESFAAGGGRRPNTPRMTRENMYNYGEHFRMHYNEDWIRARETRTQEAWRRYKSGQYSGAGRSSSSSSTSSSSSSFTEETPQEKWWRENIDEKRYPGDTSSAYAGRTWQDLSEADRAFLRRRAAIQRHASVLLLRRIAKWMFVFTIVLFFMPFTMR